jgi:Polyketide cyclase / dehydrase and lipid transport
VLAVAPASALESSVRGTSSAPADAVWAKIGDFCAIGKWHPAIEKRAFD